MPYSTADMVKERAPGTLMPNGAPDKYAGAITKGIKWADAWIDSRLASKFEDRLPFCEPPPQIIQEISADLAASKVLRATFAGGGESKTPTLAQDLFDLAELALDRLLNGSMSLPKPADEMASGPSLGVYVESDSKKLLLKDFDLVNIPRCHGGTIPLAPYKAGGGGYR